MVMTRLRLISSKNKHRTKVTTGWPELAGRKIAAGDVTKARITTAQGVTLGE